MRLCLTEYNNITIINNMTSGWLAAGRCDVRRLGRDSGQETALFSRRAPRGSLPSAPQNPTRLPARPLYSVPIMYKSGATYLLLFFDLFFFLRL